MQVALYARSDGLLEPRNNRAIEWVKGNAGRMFPAEIASDIRTENQNKFLNGWIYKKACELLNGAGYSIYGKTFTRDKLHVVFQHKFLVKEEFKRPDSGVGYLFESTADMSKKRFSEYIDKQVRPFLSQDYGIEVPDPDEGYWLEVYREVFGRNNG